MIDNHKSTIIESLKVIYKGHTHGKPYCETTEI
jgi:hypothetical protein